ncbi:MAG: hypothetical protein LBE91_20395 [Tannerella sp.]|jgi:hypothetical protein|nr:hypothetical protein [Tannerella sp.]
MATIEIQTGEKIKILKGLEKVYEKLIAYKKKYCFLISLISLPCYAQKENVVVDGKIVGQKTYEARRDSILYEDNCGCIYYTTDKNAKSYRRLMYPIVLEDDEMEGIAEFFSERKIPMKHFQYELLNTYWTTLHWFNGDYCLYSPCDWIYEQRCLLTDSIIYTHFEDLSFFAITDYKKQYADCFQFSYVNNEVERIVSILEIKIIDQAKGISVWTWKDKEGKIEWRELKVKSENVKLFPMIIQECPEMKCIEKGIEYFEELIRQNKNIKK